MASRRLRGTLLCEDVEHERFFRRLLEKWFGEGKLHVDRIVNKGGAGDAYVVKEYVRNVQFARSKGNENYALVVVVDGDRVKMYERLRQLDQRLVDARLPKRGEEEMIAIFVPTRNVETWELWLCGDHEVDEENDYKQKFRKAEQRGEVSAKKAVQAWFRSLSPEEKNVEEERLPSLAESREEIRRLKRYRR